MPVMQRMFGDTVSQRMARTARVIDDARAVVDGVLDEVVAKCVTTVSNDLHIDVDAFRDLSAGLQRELVRSVLQPVHDGLPADASTIERVRALVDAEVGSETPIGPSYRACREHHHIVVSPRHVPHHVRFAITDSGAYVAATGVLHVSVGDVNTVSIDYHPTIAFMDADAIQGPLVWRTWEDGDRIQPLGFHGSMLVSDVLANAKAPHLSRREATVLCDNVGIVWVCGYRLANRVRIQPSTRSLLVARIHAPSLNLFPPPESDHD
jgi:tRNA(Ile)-lysidine synthase